MYILENGLKGYFKAPWEERATDVHVIGLWPLISRPVIFKCLFYLRERMHTNAPIWRSEDNFLLLLSPIIWVLWNQIQAGELHDKPLYPTDEPPHWHPKSYLHKKLLAWCLFVLFFETWFWCFILGLPGTFYSPAWAWTCNSPASASLMLRLQVYALCPTSTKFFYYMRLDS